MREADGTQALARACAIVVIVSVAFVGLVLIVGELTVGSRGVRGTALSSGDLFSGMPLRQVEASFGLFD